MRIYIDANSKSLITQTLKDCSLFSSLDFKPFDISIEKLISSDINNIYCRLMDDNSISFFLRSPNQISFLCKEIAKDFHSFESSLRVSLSELLMNSLEHGNFEINKEEKNELISSGRYYEKLEDMISKNENKFIELQYKINTPKEIIIIDQGKGFEFNKYLNAESIANTQYCGRGIFIASTELPKNNAKFEYSQNGTRLTIRF